MSDFTAKMYHIRFRLGLRPRHRWGSLLRTQDPLAGKEGQTELNLTPLSALLAAILGPSYLNTSFPGL